MNDKTEHLKMIQEVITRMNTNSFQIKGWTISLVSALLALYINSSKVAYIFIALIPVIILWILDSYYLQQERRFRALYNDVVNDETDNMKRFTMSIDKYKTCEYCIMKAIMSVTILPLYLILAVGLTVGGILIK